MYGDALTLSARYDDALAVSDSAIRLVRELRLDFALPYALRARAGAHSGRRDWRAATNDIKQALAASRRSHDSYAQHICLSCWIRMLAQRGEPASAVAINVPQLASSLPSGIAEAVASRALALASASRLKEAQESVEGIRGMSTAIEPTVLIAAVDAIVALKGGKVNASELASNFVDSAFEHGALDLLVAAYRSTPELLGLLLRRVERRDELTRLLRRTKDEDLAAALGHDVALDDPTARLSPRERDVFACLQDGLSNAQIARTLFIAESTAKLHTHRILDKLGYNDRNAIAFQALLSRKTQRSQATSATEASDDGAGSSLL
jgi:DNA-binding NarL/FixJ family response regulator